jgi:hypothetical protein
VVYKIVQKQKLINSIIKKLPQNIVPKSIDLLPNGKGFTLYLEDLNSTKGYEIRFIKEREELTIGCR